MNALSDETDLRLPEPRGELSAAVNSLLRGEPARGDADLYTETIAATAPYGEDLQLALHVCYELHYQGFAEVDPDLEWDPLLLGLRAALEQRFLGSLRQDVKAGGELGDELERLLTEPAEPGGVTAFLQREGQWWQLREYFVHRSIYHHKEADPYAWVIPRLRGQAKAALVAVEFDEFGGGRGEYIHARLFAELLDGAGLDPRYLHYLDAVPAPMLALVNMMSLFGLHRRWRGALVGHFAAVEITSPPASRRMSETLRAMNAAPACVRFYAEHIEADAVHEQVMRRDVIGDLLRQQPQLADDMIFGIRATDLLEDRVEKQLVSNWHQGRTSLRKDDVVPRF